MSNRLVTLGFRCSPELKSTLWKMADDNNISLSQFVNELASNNGIHIQGLKSEIFELQEEAKLLRRWLTRYESPELKQLFENCKGHKVVIKDNDGKTSEIVVNSLIDLHRIITKSFKLDKNDTSTSISFWK